MLYVALTRAKQVLFVSGCEPGRVGQGRGWYGFIENRLHRAGNTGEAARAGLELSTVSADDGVAVFNTYARLEFGNPESLEPIASQKNPAKFALDPLLTKPFPSMPEIGVVHPSKSIIHDEDDIPDEHFSLSETRTDVQRRGVVIHRMLERLTGGGTRSSIEMKLRHEFSDRPSTEEFNAWWREACEVVDDTGLRDFFDPARYRMARNEVPILYREGARDVFGIIDRLVMQETEVILIDYKTHARAVPGNIAQLARDFTEQMHRYAAGAHQLWPRKKLRLILLFTACGGVVELTP
mgnify:FL=1